MTEPVDRRSGNEELVRRVETIEKKMDELLMVFSSGKGALRILYWLGLAVVFLATSWDWIMAHLPRASG